MSFKFGFCFNMQLATIKRMLINKLRFGGQFFHSPYPDYYAMTLLLKKSRKNSGVSLSYDNHRN